MNVIDIPLEQIEVGERRRADFGDVGALAKGIKRVGLLEAIIVDRNGKKDCFRLIAGERRLRAVRMLKWKTIPASLLEHLTDEELRDIELEENQNRKSLTEQEERKTFASSKKLVENAKRAKEVLAQSGQKPSQKGTKGGRPALPDSSQAVADALGTSRQAVERAEQHVATAETFPWMQGNTWKQSDVLAVREHLEEMKPEVRDDTVAILGAAKMLDPTLTKNLIGNIRAMPATERKEVLQLSQSDDSRQRSLALTKAAQLPPMPDPRLNSLEAALASLQRASKPFPNDPLTPQIEKLVADLRKIYAAVKAVSYDARRGKEGSVQ